MKIASAFCPNLWIEDLRFGQRLDNTENFNKRSIFGFHYKYVNIHSTIIFCCYLLTELAPDHPCNLDISLPQPPPPPPGLQCQPHCYHRVEECSLPMINCQYSPHDSLPHRRECVLEYGCVGECYLQTRTPRPPRSTWGGENCWGRGSRSSLGGEWCYLSPRLPG